MSEADSTSPQQRTAVVFGATGFVGRNICAALHAAGWSVIGVARGTGRDPSRSGEAGAGADVEGCRRLLRIDVAQQDAGTLAAALVPLRPAFVVNAAGAVWNVGDDQLAAGNVTLVGRIVDAVAALPRPVRLVHIGSAYEYGSHPERSRLAEDLLPRPVSRYAQSKLAGTRIVAQAAAAGRVDAVVLRLTLASGPHAPRHGLLGGLARQLAERPDVLRLPPIDSTRDIVDARDVADAVLCAAAVPQAPPVVNIGSGTRTRLTDAVDLLIKIAGCTAPIVRDPAPAVRRDSGIGDQPLDISLAKRRLGWTPVRTLPDTLQALWESVARRSQDHHYVGN